jgi:hypothetical protein
VLVQGCVKMLQKLFLLGDFMDKSNELEQSDALSAC